MPTRINRLLIPLFILIIFSFGKQSNSFGQAPTTSIYLPIVSYNPAGWIGPYGGTITTIAVDPTNAQKVYAGSFGSGVFKSTDGGHYWVSANRGLTNLNVYSLAVDPSHPSTLFAGTYHNQVFKSIDGGATWSWSGSGMQDSAIVYSIAVDPENGSNVYACTRGISNNNNPPWNGVLYKSVDGGETWTPSLFNVGGVADEDWAYSMVINPNKPGQIFAALHEHGPYRSDDYGATWHSIPDGVRDLSGRSIIISPQLDYSSNLFFGVWHFDSVYKTINSGKIWTGANHYIPNVMVYSMAIDPYSPDTVYMGTFSHGILKTIDGGNSWQPAGLDTDKQYSIVINPTMTQNLFTGTSGDGLFRSLDYSMTWQKSDFGINNAMATSVVHHPTNPLLMYSSVYGAGVYQSGNKGQTWEELDTGLEDKWVHDLVMNPAQPQLLYALTDTGGLFKNDLFSGLGWVSIGQGLPLTNLPTPAFSADDPFATVEMQEYFTAPQVAESPNQVPVGLLEMVYAPSDPQIAYIGTNGAGVYRSLNGGNSWQSADLGGYAIRSLAVDFTDPNLVYATTDYFGSLKYSPDGGINWSDAFLQVFFYSVATSPFDSGVVYAGTSAGVYRYQSGNFTALGLSNQSVTCVAVDPTHPGVIYAGTTDGAYYSVDDGQTWNFVDDHLDGHTILSINIDPTNPNVVYFSTKTHGIYLASIRF